MAETVVSFLFDQLSTFLNEEAKLLGGLREEVEYIKTEMGLMKGFLRVADAKEDHDSGLHEWIQQVRDAAYDIEDVLDEFMLRFSRHHADGLSGCVQRILNSVKNLRARHRVASHIQSIKKKLASISEGRQRYQLEYGSSSQRSGNAAANISWRNSRDDALLLEESKLVGIEKPKRMLISRLLDSDSQFKVVSVVGMGGLGKTTLVKRVHEDPHVKTEFQVRAWLTVSQTCDINDLLKDMIQQFHEEMKQPVPQQVDSMKGDRLKKFVKDFLQDKRYVIVFDDVWDIGVWNNIKLALPDGSCGNRVMLTTRIADVASASCLEHHGFVYKMNPLSTEESWTLFYNKTFEDHCCPDYLKDVSLGILSKCEGLPLAIIAISGVLALKDKSNKREWEIVQCSLGGELEGSGKLERVRNILSLSYNDLPCYLKICLLYVSIFPEDYQILCDQLVRLWAAERFVQVKAGMTTEEVAWDHLNELINRSLIQVTEGLEVGLPVTCHIHDLLREIILAKSEELNIVTVAMGQDTRWPEKVRRLAIHNFHGNTQESICFKHLRSLLTFGTMEHMSNSRLDEILRGGSRLLKVLDQTNAQLEEIPDEVFNLFHLKYLCLRNTRVETVPKSIVKLQNLEYLDLVDTKVSELPVEILKLQKLRQLILGKNGNIFNDFVSSGFQAPYKLGGLIYLQYLYHIDADSENIIVTEIGKLTQLKKLSITQLRRENGKQLCSSLEKLTNLSSLMLFAIAKDEIMDLDYPLPSARLYLRRLFLYGRLEKVPQWIPFLQSLTRIDLLWSEFRDDPLEKLQDLPNLVALVLNQAYQGKELCFKAGGFPKLKALYLEKMRDLVCVRAEKNAMPHLQKLGLAELQSVEELPWGIEHLRELRVLAFRDVNEKLIAKIHDGDRALEETEDYSKIFHVPEVIISRYRENGIWAHTTIRKKWMN